VILLWGEPVGGGDVTDRRQCRVRWKCLGWNNAVSPLSRDQTPRDEVSIHHTHSLLLFHSGQTVQVWTGPNVAFLLIGLLVTANVVPSSMIIFTLTMEAIRSSETLVITTATRRNIPEHGIIHSHCHENLKSYRVLTAWTRQRRRNVSPVRYELGFCISEGSIRYSRRRETHKY
jgi:hypothetical protein